MWYHVVDMVSLSFACGHTMAITHLKCCCRWPEPTKLQRRRRVQGITAIALGYHMAMGTLVPSEHQKCWEIGVHPTKADHIRF